jgi:hypothetical protein
MRKVMVVIGSLLALSRASHYAQDCSSAEAFGGYSYVSINTNSPSSRQNASGWGGGLSADPSAVFVVEEDLNGCCKTRPAGFAAFDMVHDYSYLAGPRVYHRVIWFTETARALE